MSSAPRQRVTVDEAVELVLGHLGNWGMQRVALAAAAGEILRETLYTEREQPPFDRVTMDGMAISHRACSEVRLIFNLAGTQCAGDAP